MKRTVDRSGVPDASNVDVLSPSPLLDFHRDISACTTRSTLLRGCAVNRSKSHCASTSVAGFLGSAACRYLANASSINFWPLISSETARLSEDRCEESHHSSATIAQEFKRSKQNLDPNSQVPVKTFRRSVKLKEPSLSDICYEGY